VSLEKKGNAAWIMHPNITLSTTRIVGNSLDLSMYNRVNGFGSLYLYARRGELHPQSGELPWTPLSLHRIIDCTFYANSMKLTSVYGDVTVSGTDLYQTSSDTSYLQLIIDSSTFQYALVQIASHRLGAILGGSVAVTNAIVNTIVTIKDSLFAHQGFQVYTRLLSQCAVGAYYEAMTGFHELIVRVSTTIINTTIDSVQSTLNIGDCMQSVSIFRDSVLAIDTFNGVKVRESPMVSFNYYSSHSGRVFIQNSTFDHMPSIGIYVVGSSRGGGYRVAVDVTVVSSRFTNASITDERGGSITVKGVAHLSIMDTLIADNRALMGTAISATSGALIMINRTTIYGNHGTAHLFSLKSVTRVIVDDQSQLSCTDDETAIAIDGSTHFFDDSFLRSFPLTTHYALDFTSLNSLLLS
jgi:hypothetical protein